MKQYNYYTCQITGEVLGFENRRANDENKFFCSCHRESININGIDIIE